MASHDDLPMAEHPVLRRHLRRTDGETAEEIRVIRSPPKRLAGERAKRAAQARTGPQRRLKTPGSTIPHRAHSRRARARCAPDPTPAGIDIVNTVAEPARPGWTYHERRIVRVRAETEPAPQEQKDNVPRPRPRARTAPPAAVPWERCEEH